jgi:hypothetical protein
MRRTAAIPIAAALTAIGCYAPPLEAPQPACVAQPTRVIPQQIKDKVDLLFMVDNSNSMDAMQTALKQKFPQLFQALSQIAAAGTPPDLHVGVVTSDFGAGSTGAGTFCGPYGSGQGGRLQPIGQYAAAGCMPPVGANYIQFNYKDGSSNLPAGQDLVATFTCMASVGSMGCGFEHQLESAYAALHDNIPENAGFLRDDALLAVVFLTNEDDSSAPPTSDLFDPTKVSEYGIEDSYRSTRFGILCGGQMPPYGPSNGPLASCVPAPDGLEFGVQRYIDFFTKAAVQGGVKRDPKDVILVAIDAPEDPVEIDLTQNPNAPEGQYPDCPVPTVSDGNPLCTPVLAHSCRNSDEPAFYGDPAVRLNTVVRAASHHAIASICASDYSSAMKQVTDLISVNLLPACIPASLTDLSNPDCAVEDVTTNVDTGVVTVNVIPSCATQPDANPCWSVQAQTACSSISPDGVAVVVDRKGANPPPDTDVRFACATRCQ